MADKVAPSAPASQQALLEQFLLLGKTAKGAAAVELIKNVLETPGIFVFGELLDMPNIIELNNTENAPHYSLLNLFAFGTYTNYMENKSQFPELTPPMLHKLRQLTIVSLATQNKCIPYARLLKELDIQKMRELEDLIIDVIYADIVRGKLDQGKKHLEVDFTIGRDIRPADVSTAVSVLHEWCDCCEAVLSSIDCQIVKANTLKETQLKLKSQIENEVTTIKKSLKVQSQEEEQSGTEAKDEKPTRKLIAYREKGKLLRSAGKFWHK